MDNSKALKFSLQMEFLFLLLQILKALQLKLFYINYPDKTNNTYLIKIYLRLIRPMFSYIPQPVNINPTPPVIEIMIPPIR
jgi:hypothetical protein